LCVEGRDVVFGVRVEACGLVEELGGDLGLAVVGLSDDEELVSGVGGDDGVFSGFQISVRDAFGWGFEPEDFGGLVAVVEDLEVGLWLWGGGGDEPFEHACLPCVPHRALVSVEAVIAGGEFEVGVRDFVLVESGVEFAAVIAGDDVVVDGVGEVGGWGVRGDVEFGGVALDEGGCGVFSEEVFAGAAVGAFAHGDDGVDEDGEVGAGTVVLDGIGRGGVWGIEAGGGGGGEVASGGEADDADAGGVAGPVGGILSGDADGALGIEERDLVAAGGESVFEDEAGDVVLIEPLGDVVAFGAGDESAVSAAGADDDGGAVGGGGAVEGECGFGGLGGAVAEGCLIGPEQDGLRICCDEGLEREEGEKGQEAGAECRAGHGEVTVRWGRSLQLGRLGEGERMKVMGCWWADGEIVTWVLFLQRIGRFQRHEDLYGWFEEDLCWDSCNGVPWMR